MSRRSILLALGIVLLLAGGSAAALYALVHHVPEEYKKAAVPPGPDRVKSSNELLTQVSLMSNATRAGQESEWQLKLSEKQINSFLAEDFVKSRMDQELLPPTISAPRVLLDKDRITLAFRYREGLWSTIISLELKPWLPKHGDPNVIAMQLQGLRAGHLPINAQSLLKEITNATREHGIQIRWYRYDGNPVALIRFQADKPQSTVKLDHVQIQDGELILQGKPTSKATRVAAATPKQKAKRPALR